MSLLMQALRKAERARATGQNGHEVRDDTQFAHDIGAAPHQPFPPAPAPEPASPDASAAPQGPPSPLADTNVARPDAWRLEPLHAAPPGEMDPPVEPAQEAAHDPVPPQARHEPTAGTPLLDELPPPRPRRAPARPPGMAAAAAMPPPRRLIVLVGALLALLSVFAFIYWRAVSAPGPGSSLPMVPMPAPGAQPGQAAGGQSAAIPVTPTPGGMPAGAPGATAAPMPGAAYEQGAAIPGAAGEYVAAPPTQPQSEVTVPTPEQLAAIQDPAIREEAMRDAAERAARQVTAFNGASPETGAEDASTVGAPRAAASAAGGPGTPAGSAAGPAAEPRAAPAAARGERRERTPRTRSAASSAATPAPPPTAVGENGDVRFVRSAGAQQIAPAVQQGYNALKAGDLAAARQQYDLALTQDPNNRDALLGAATVALREQNGTQATANYLRLLELDPQDPEALAALALLRPGDLAASEVRLRGLARQHPQSGPVQFALGNLYARQGRWPEAQQSYFRAYTAVPDNADYAFNLGVGLDRMNQARLAQQYYRRALELAQAAPPAFDINAVRKRLQELETPSP